MKYDPKDINKDGVVNIQDIIGSQADAKDYQTNVISNSIGQGLLGMLKGGIANPTAILTGAIGAATGAAQTETPEQLKQKIADIGSSVGYSPDEIKTLQEYVDISQRVDTATGGAISKSQSKVDILLQRAQQISEIKTPSTTTFGGREISQGISGTNTGTGQDTLIKENQAQVSNISKELGINLSDIPLDKDYAKNVQARLDKNKTELGFYSFPAKEYNINALQLSDNEKNVLTKANAISSGALETSTKNADGTTTLSVKNTEGKITNTIFNADGSIKSTNTETGTPATITNAQVDINGNPIITTPDGTTTAMTANGTTTIPSGTTSTGMTAPSGTGHKTTDYIGLPAKDAITGEVYGIDANGNPTKTKAQYTYGDVDTMWNNMGEAQRMQLKKQLYAANLYGSTDLVNVVSGNITDSDKSALAKALGTSNLNGVKVDDYLKPIYENYLVTGRPAGDAAVDINHDGKVDAADADVNTALKSFLSRNGLQVTDSYIKSYTDAIKSGSTTYDDSVKQIRDNMIVSAYPSLKDQLDKGLDVADIASPYVQTMAKTLGISTDNISLNDPAIKSALSYSGADGKPAYKSLFDFEKDLRKDPRWQNTDAAQKEYADTAFNVLKTFGILG